MPQFILNYDGQENAAQGDAPINDKLEENDAFAVIVVVEFGGGFKLPPEVY